MRNAVGQTQNIEYLQKDFLKTKVFYEIKFYFQALFISRNSRALANKVID